MGYDEVYAQPPEVYIMEGEFVVDEKAFYVYSSAHMVEGEEGIGIGGENAALLRGQGVEGVGYDSERIELDAEYREVRGEGEPQATELNAAFDVFIH